MNINQHDLSDDELDHLFRDSAEKMNFDFDPDSWTKMSQKLDAINISALGENQAGNVWLKRGLSMLLALLFLIGGYFLFKPSLNLASTPLQTKHKNTSEVASEVDAKKYVTTDKVGTDNLNNDTSEKIVNSKELINDSKSIDYENKKDKNKITIAPKSENTDKYLVNNKIENAPKSQKKDVVINTKSEKPITNQLLITKKQSAKTESILIDKPKGELANTKIAETNSIANEAGENKKGNKVRQVNSDINSKSPINNIISGSNEVEKLSESNSIAVITEEKNQRWQLENVKSLTPKIGLFKSSFNLPIIAFESPKNDSPMPVSKSASFKKGLNIRLGVSPDFSIVTIDEIARLGSNWAALLEYRFNNRLSVHSGVIRSMKYYNSYPESYEWPNNWPQPPVLIDINATCKMLDIPLNVRFDITQKPNSRLFVSAGSTSYIMLKEKYTYNYENQSDPKIKWRNWEGKTGPYNFSVLNFSFGYEHQIFRRLSLQAEPFLKVPIGKVGFGKVNLSTIGIFFSAKYPIAKF
ncbi:hypothetical protein [Emticicia sp. SJ17W-69]|uniref:hypothetical protein n=1 Tax=Emticicia sp. SJ17W-69 TaxID=3421657 RepID=UPI003EC05460